MSSEAASDASQTDKSEIQAPTSDSADGAWSSRPLMGLCCALVAGLAAWLVVHAAHPVFATTEGADEWGFLPLDVQWRLDRNNSMFVLGLVGGLVGLALAIGEGLARRSPRVMLEGGAACGALGLVAGGLAGYLGHRAFEQVRANAEINDLNKAIYVNAVFFATLGAGVGLGLGFILTRRPRVTVKCLIAGLLAGGLASVIYPVIVAALLPAAMTSVLLPLETGERLLWFGLLTGLLGIFIPVMALGGCCGKTASSSQH
ncbi:MAG: hypothetical protein L0Y42_10260 [Phycisphaerales bacterium]|nr:hypothetical protein [Phycisphaerales bacterium]